MTPTRKVKRALMYERFKALVEAMYDDSEERLLADSGAVIALKARAERQTETKEERRCVASI